jgi:multidrug efflux pump subunit AcrA (membrane-fusion protein)
MLATLSINDENLTNVISVPSNLVQKDATGNMYLMIAEGANDKMVARKKLVSTGVAYSDKVVITEGLSGTEQIIVSGYQEVVDGQSITLK